MMIKAKFSVGAIQRHDGSGQRSVLAKRLLHNLCCIVEAIFNLAGSGV